MRIIVPMTGLILVFIAFCVMVWYFRRNQREEYDRIEQDRRDRMTERLLDDE